MTDDAALRNEDWLRTRSWDLPTTLNGYLATVVPGPREPLADAVRRRLELPSAEAMPAKLRAAVDDWLAKS